MVSITYTVRKFFTMTKNDNILKAILWGVDNEDEAVKAFTKSTGIHPVDRGIWLDESGILDASPGGLVGEDTVLEEKCPYTQRNLLISEAVKSSSFCLKADEARFSLKRDRLY